MTVSTIGGGEVATNPFDIGGRLLPPQQLPARGDQFERMGKWLELFMATAEVAKVLARTAFVPEPMRGQPEDIAAAMMKALELGIDPLDGLSSMHVVKGKVGFSAEFMRRRIIEAGHEIEFDETTDDRCKMRGRRAGADKWQTVTFTAENARKAKINLGDYPADKLVARASSRMCRRVFPDVLAGAAIIEDIIDGEIVEGTFEAPAAAAQPAQPSLQRKRQPRKAAAAQPQPPAPDEAQTAPASDLDEFPGGWDAQMEKQTQTTIEALDRERAESAKVQPTPSQQAADANDDPTHLNRRMHVLFGKADLDKNNREDRLTVTSAIVGRPIESSNDLSLDEAQKLVDRLGQWERDGVIGERVTDILNEAAIREADATEAAAGEARE